MFLQKRRLEVANLYEPPLTRFGADAVDKWFSEKEVDEIVEFAQALRTWKQTCQPDANRHQTPLAS